MNQLPRCPSCKALVEECECGNMITIGEAFKIVQERWTSYTRAEKRAWLAKHKHDPIAMALVEAVEKYKH